ncbi:MAG: hypothetical protein MUF87_17870 [Anaerolineae bacterium]|jgi:DNA-binding MarR family transcriptional regulator|nr:hypothetical protein [Anaerolineae bacterium]
MCHQYQQNATVESVYAFLKRFIDEHGYAPNLREIARGCYMSTSTVTRSLDCLEAQGRISREIGRARSIRLWER